MPRTVSPPRASRVAAAQPERARPTTRYGPSNWAGRGFFGGGTLTEVPSIPIAVDLPAETAQGKALFEELLWVHAMIRRDLQRIAILSGEVIDGLSAAQARAQIEELKTAGPLWQLKVNCLRYCRFVHLHHNAEDTLFFPSLRAANPELGPIVDRLEADHRSVSGLLDAVEAAAAELDAGQRSRQRLAERLEALAAELLAHLDYEELKAGPTIRRLEGLGDFTAPG